MSRLRGFGGFWYDFVVGDDWRLALAGAAALAVCGLLSHLDVTSWWLVPAVVVATLTLTLIRMPPPVPAVEPASSESLPWADPERAGSTTEVDE
jgi:hypothetical protein